MSTILLPGTTKWTKVYEDQKQESYDKKGHEFTMDFYPSDAGWVIYKRSQLQLKDRTDDDGGRFIKLRRKDKETNFASGEVTDNGPPKVYFKDEQTGEYTVRKDNPRIGNGSEVQVAIEVYKSKNGMGHRLMRVFVDKLVPYGERATNEDTPDEAKLPF